MESPILIRNCCSLTNSFCRLPCYFVHCLHEGHSLEKWSIDMVWGIFLSIQLASAQIGDVNVGLMEKDELIESLPKNPSYFRFGVGRLAS